MHLTSSPQAANNQTPPSAPAPIVVVDCRHTLSQIGLSSRRQQCGPETDLVNWFLQELPIRLPARCYATIFREPRIDSGFPDIVVAVWHRSRIANWGPKKWQPARAKVKSCDLRVMHYAFERGAVDQDELEKTFRRPITASLKRLSNADMLRQDGISWFLNGHPDSFGLQNLIAIEAKMTNVSAAVRQAISNTWFASNSYVLLPKAPRDQVLVEAAAAYGVAVLAQDQAPFDWSALPAADEPRSYASWQFSEWVWRHAELCMSET